MRKIRYKLIQFLGALVLICGGPGAASAKDTCSQALSAAATHVFGAVKEVAAGPLIAVEGGTMLTLAGLVVPRAPRNRKRADAAKIAAAAEGFLRRALRGARISAVPGFANDRHGRKVAQLFTSVDADAPRTWLQAAMVSAGYARVWPTARHSACAAELLALEAEARAKKAGAWALKRFEVLPAWATRKLRSRENSFQLVEGRVAAVAETKRTTYVNFGKDWRTDFTVNISARAAKRFQKSGVSLAALKGKRVRVRGWVRYANGPMIRVSTPQQVETLEQPPSRPDEKPATETN